MRPSRGGVNSSLEHCITLYCTVLLYSIMYTCTLLCTALSTWIILLHLEPSSCWRTQNMFVAPLSVSSSYTRPTAFSTVTKQCTLQISHYKPGMSRNDFCTFGIGNGKWPSLFPTFGIGNGNEKSNYHGLGLGMGRGKSRIREIKHLSTNADSSTDTIKILTWLT